MKPIFNRAPLTQNTLAQLPLGSIRPEGWLADQMRTQAEIAIETADAIIFMCDVHAGLVADDRDIAIMLKKSGKHVFHNNTIVSQKSKYCNIFSKFK